MEVCRSEVLPDNVKWYTIRNPKSNRILRDYQKWIAQAQKDGVGVIGIIHGKFGKYNCRKLNKLYDGIRKDERVDKIFSPEYDTGIVYIALKTK